MLQNEVIVRDAVPSPLRRTFDYRLPDHWVSDTGNPTPKPGTRVAVSFGRRKVVGLVIEIGTDSEFPLEKIKPIDALIDSEPLLS